MPRVPIPVAAPIEPRAAGTDKDCLLRNCYVEKQASGLQIVKRPGLTQHSTVTAACGQGILVDPSGNTIVVRGDEIITSSVAVSDLKIWTKTGTVGYSSGAGAPVAKLGNDIYALSPAGGPSQGIVRSTDKGANWVTQTTNAQFAFGFTPFSVAFLGFNNRLLVIGGQGNSPNISAKVYSSTDLGVSWGGGGAFGDLPNAVAKAGYCVHKGYIYLVGGRHNTWGSFANVNPPVWRSNNGSSWTVVNSSTPLSARTFPAVVSLGQRLFVIKGLDLNGQTINDMWYSDDDGASWTQGPTPNISGVPFPFLVNIKGVIYGIDSQQNVYRSVDGITWTTYLMTTPISPSGYAGFSLVKYDEHVIAMLATGEGVWESSENTTSGGTTTVTSVTGSMTACLPVDFAMSQKSEGGQYIVVKSSESAFYSAPNSTSFIQITDADYPTETVRGIVYLDGYFFVMTPEGVIYNSDLNNPASWAALSFISANSHPDFGVAIARQLNYVVALKEWSIEFFYDAGNPVPGSPLSKVLNALLELGCASGGSLATSDNMLYFISQSRTFGRGVHRMTGYQPEKISNEWVDRILNADDLAGVTAYVTKSNGHGFYHINLPTSGFTLKYDSTTGVWCQDTSLTVASPITVSSLTYSATTGLVTATFGSGQAIADGDPVTIAGASPAAYNGLVVFLGVAGTTYTYVPLSVPGSSPATGTITATPYTESRFIGKFHSSSATADLFLGNTNGIIYQMSAVAFDDVGAPINMRARLPEFDAGNFQEKFMGQLEVVADKVAGTIYQRHSDDDYQTRTLYRPVNLALRRSRLFRLGRFVRRALEFRYTAATALRIRRIETEIDGGDG